MGERVRIYSASLRIIFVAVEIGPFDCAQSLPHSTLLRASSELAEWDML